MIVGRSPHLGSWTKEEAEVPRAPSRLQNGAGRARPPNKAPTQASSNAEPSLLPKPLSMGGPPWPLNPSADCPSLG